MIKLMQANILNQFAKYLKFAILQHKDIFKKEEKKNKRTNHMDLI